MFYFWCHHVARGAAKKAKQKREAELPEQTKIEINFGEAPFKNMAFILNGFAPVLTKITGTPTL